MDSGYCCPVLINGQLSLTAGAYPGGFVGSAALRQTNAPIKGDIRIKDNNLHAE